MSTWTTPERPEPPNNPIDERAALEEPPRVPARDVAAEIWRADAGTTGAAVGAAVDALAARPCFGTCPQSTAWFHAYNGQPGPHVLLGLTCRDREKAPTRSPSRRAADDLASYQASVVRSREAVAGRSLDEARPGEDYTLRWIYLHMIEEYARHNGHADFLRERIDGATGE
jgi:hypothetical protein